MTPTAVWVMLVCILQTSQVLCQGNACQEPQALITGGRYRVEDEQFTASSSFSETYLPHEARLEGNSWCAEEGNDTGSWIQVDFGADVIIQELLIGGDGGAAQFYVNLFRIEHGPNSDQLSSILQANSTDPMVFTRPDSPDVSITVLPTPLTTRVLRIVSVVHTGSGLCLNMEAIGCVLSPGCAMDELLSTNRSLLPLSSITASTAMPDFPAEHVVDMSQTGWCTAEQFSDTQPTPYIVFNFTERVAITYMRARGGRGGFSYVTEFSLDYRDDYTDSYTPYTLINGEEFEAGFTTDSAGLQTYTFWRQPLQGRTFRFKIQDGERHFLNQNFCWNVELFGCSVPEQAATTDVHTTTDPTTSDTTQSTPTNSPQQTDNAMTTTMLVSAGNTGAIVGAAVGGATFVLVILLVTIIILVVWKRMNIRTEVTTPGSSTVQIADNEANSVETRSPNTLENMGEVFYADERDGATTQNIAYGRLVENGATNLTWDPNTLENMSEVYSEPIAIAYEPITMTTLNPPNTYESINIPDLEYAQVDTMKGCYSNTEEGDGDMTQNIAYGKLVENGATSLPETEDGYELVWL